MQVSSSKQISAETCFVGKSTEAILRCRGHLSKALTWNLKQLPMSTEHTSSRHLPPPRTSKELSLSGTSSRESGTTLASRLEKARHGAKQLLAHAATTSLTVLPPLRSCSLRVPRASPGCSLRREPGYPGPGCGRGTRQTSAAVAACRGENRGHSQESSKSRDSPFHSPGLSSRRAREGAASPRAPLPPCVPPGTGLEGHV